MNRRYPRYPDDADYQTNAPSYYDDLARKQKLIEMLAKKIWEYEETLDLTLEEITNRLESYIEENDNLMTDRLEQWDLNLEKFPENVELLLQEWLSDGTLDHIINETIFNWKADKTYVDDLNNEINEQIDQIFINVKKHGAKGDGITDDTVAILQALNTGNKIYFPKGNYVVSEILDIPSNTEIFGEGQGNSVIEWEVTDTKRYPVIRTQRNSDKQHTFIHDIGINQKRTERLMLDDQASNGITPINNVTIERVKIENTIGAGISGSGGIENIIIRDCDISNTGHHTIYFSTKDSDRVNNVLIENNRLGQPATIEGLQFGASQIKFRHDKATDVIKNITIQNNLVASVNSLTGGMIVYFSSTNGDEPSRFENITIHNNVFNEGKNKNNPISHGIYFASWSIGMNVQVTNNTIYGTSTGTEASDTYGIRFIPQVAQRSENVIIRGNSIYDFSIGIEAYHSLVTENVIHFTKYGLMSVHPSEFIRNKLLSNQDNAIGIYRSNVDSIENEFILTGTGSTAIEISAIQNKNYLNNVIIQADTGFNLLKNKEIIGCIFNGNRFNNVTAEYRNRFDYAHNNIFDGSITERIVASSNLTDGTFWGERVFHRDFNKPIWWDNTKWVDAMGESIS